MANIVFKVTGMKCGGCENQVKESLMACNGIERVTANHKTNSVEVDYTPDLTTLDVIRQTITGKGFTVEQ
ncbi:MAG: heavy-metal-associated domain-containing protein [Methylococcaceae bacterium]